MIASLALRLAPRRAVARVDTMASAAEELLRQPDLSLAEPDAIARRS